MRRTPSKRPPPLLVLLAPGLLIAALAVALPACRKAPQERLVVAASVFPLYDLTRRIAGEDADVVLVLPPGESPERAAPPPSMPEAASRARAYVMVGLGLDAWMDGLVSAQVARAPKTRVLRVGDRVPTLAQPGNGDAVAPYVWLDPQRARLIATAIVEDLARADSSHATAFRKRAEALDAQLASLDEEIGARAKAWTSRAFAAPAGCGACLAYYADHYHLEVSASAPHAVPSIDALGGTTPDTSTYEGLVRFDTAALEKALR